MGLNGHVFFRKSFVIWAIHIVLSVKITEARSVSRAGTHSYDKFGAPPLKLRSEAGQPGNNAGPTSLDVIYDDKSRFLVQINDRKYVILKSGIRDRDGTSSDKENDAAAVNAQDRISDNYLNNEHEIRESSNGFDKVITPSNDVKLSFRGGSVVFGESVLAELRSSIAHLLHVPVTDVFTRKPQSVDDVVDMYVLKSGRRLLASTTNADLIPARTVLEQITNSQFNSKSTLLDVKAYTYKSSDSSSDWTWQFVTQPWFPYVAAAVSAIIVSAVLALICCCVRWRRKKNELSQQQQQHQLQHRRQQLTLYPLSKPDLQRSTAATTIQPVDAGAYYLSQSAPVPANAPVRLRTNGRPKGLLESRRGSSASLTIDLTPMMEAGKCGSPPKESPSREFLLSAGNRMTRKQLRKCMKNIKGLYDEFWAIPMNHPSRLSVTGVGIKNRYKTILPNEHSRIRLAELDGDPSSTYINANYIRGYAGEPRAYIATQGCMSNTVCDLWRMIWHEQCPCVVMITKLAEKDRVKCEEYFPLDTQCECYGEVEVSVASIQPRDGYEIRMLNVRHAKYVNDERTVLHFWFTSWPDHKTPETPKQLLDMVRDVEAKRFIPGRRDKPKGPVVVHCSAGIGRTGCFIGISIGIRQLLEEQMIDVLGIVCQMRLDRGGMVQNNEQYEFVHRALALFEKSLPQQSPSGD